LLAEIRSYVRPRRAQVEQAIEVLRSTEEGSALMSVRRPIIAVLRVPRQFWGALAFWPFILVSPGYLDRPPEAIASTLAHEYGHLRQQRYPLEWVDSVEQEYVAEQAGARFRSQYTHAHPGAWNLEAEEVWLSPEREAEAFQRIRGWGKFYAILPERNPRWYQVKQYWPIVRFWLLGR
jgi:hypothetical protein